MCFEAATTAKEVATIPGDDEHHNLCHDGYMMVMVMMMLMRNIFIFVIMTRMMVVMKMVMMSMFIFVMVMLMRNIFIFVIMTRMMVMSKLVMMTMIVTTLVKLVRELSPSTTLSTATATSRPRNPCYWVLDKERHEKSWKEGKDENHPKVVEKRRG